MDDNIRIWEGASVVPNNVGKKLPLGRGHGALDEVVFGVDFVTHDETGVNDDVTLFEHSLKTAQFFDAVGGKEELGSERPAGGVFDITLEEGVGLKKVGI